MTKKADEIYNELKRLTLMDTGNAVEVISVYKVKLKEVLLYIGKTPSGKSFTYDVEMRDNEIGELSRVGIRFNVYPYKAVSIGDMEGNNGNRIYYSNSGINNSLREILKAISRLYNLPIAKRI